MVLRKVFELNFNDSLNKHYRTVLDNIKYDFVVFKKRNKVLLSKKIQSR